ncbi:MAG: transcription antitermination protein NusB [Alphaproteobacteria bacterium]|nr:transcription antitermination protein NusB [Alphaproteobacteria bacterium]
MTSTPKTKPSHRSSAKARNSAARLLAVQAVYQMHKNDQNAEDVIRELLEFRAGKDYEGDGEVMVAPNEDHFALVVRGVSEHIAQLGDMISQNRGKSLEEESFKRNEPLLQAIFLCAAFELMVLQSIHYPVIISDYLHVTHAFFEEGEAKLVNALLDSMRKTVRD